MATETNPAPKVSFYKRWDVPQKRCEQNHCPDQGVAVELRVDGEYRETQYLCERHVKSATST